MEVLSQMLITDCPCSASQFQVRSRIANHRSYFPLKRHSAFNSRMTTIKTVLDLQIVGVTRSRSLIYFVFFFVYNAVYCCEWKSVITELMIEIKSEKEKSHVPWFFCRRSSTFMTSWIHRSISTFWHFYALTNFPSDRPFFFLKWNTGTRGSEKKDSVPCSSAL